MHPEDAAAALLEKAYQVQWQWFDDYWQTWSDYTLSQNQVIEQAWHDPETQTVNIDGKNWPSRWVINLVSLTQKPLDGGHLALRSTCSHHARLSVIMALGSHEHP